MKPNTDTCLKGTWDYIFIIQIDHVQFSLQNFNELKDMEMACSYWKGICACFPFFLELFNWQ